LIDPVADQETDCDGSRRSPLSAKASARQVVSGVQFDRACAAKKTVPQHDVKRQGSLR
jgi:hypothetical protein